MAISEVYDSYARSCGVDSQALRTQIADVTSAIDQVLRAESADAVQAAAKLAREAWAKAEATLADVAKQTEAAQATARKGGQEVERIIRERPLLSVSIAAAAGFLLASLVRR